MLNGYKLVAVCLTKIQDEVTYEFIDALYQAVKGSDYRLLLFNSFSDLYHQNVYDEGAKSIYQLLNYDLVDAVIIKADTINDHQVIRGASAMHGGALEEWDRDCVRCRKFRTGAYDNFTSRSFKGCHYGGLQ